MRGGSIPALLMDGDGRAWAMTVWITKFCPRLATWICQQLWHRTRLVATQRHTAPMPHRERNHHGQLIKKSLTKHAVLRASSCSCSGPCGTACRLDFQAELLSDPKTKFSKECFTVDVCCCCAEPVVLNITEIQDGRVDEVMPRAAASKILTKVKITIRSA